MSAAEGWMQRRTTRQNSTHAIGQGTAPYGIRRKVAVLLWQENASRLLASLSDHDGSCAAHSVVAGFHPSQRAQSPTSQRAANRRHNDTGQNRLDDRRSVDTRLRYLLR